VFQREGGDADALALAAEQRALPLSSAPSSLWPVDAFPSVTGLVRPVPLVSGAWWVPVYSKRLIRAPSRPHKQVEASHKSVLARSMAMMRKLVVNPMDTPAPHKPHVGNKHAYARMQVCLTCASYFAITKHICYL